jgi:putative oxidoreductase
MERLTAWSPRVLSILRIVTGLLFLEHGLMKIFQFPVPQKGVPDPLPPLILTAGWMELVGGALILIGLLTRPAAFLLSGEMAYAYWSVHAKASPYPAVNEGELAVLYCFVFFYFIFAGGGPWSLDAMIRRPRP